MSTQYACIRNQFFISKLRFLLIISSKVIGYTKTEAPILFCVCHNKILLLLFWFCCCCLLVRKSKTRRKFPKALIYYKHDDVIIWKHFPCYWPFVRGIHRSTANSPHKGQWRGALMVSLICASNKRLSKQSWGWWFETSLRSLWRHCNKVELIY